MRKLVLTFGLVVGCNAATAPSQPVPQAPGGSQLLRGVLQGTISLAENQVGGRVASSVTAAFGTGRQHPSASGCTIEQSGACRLVSCPSNTPGFGDGYFVPKQYITTTVKVDGARRPLPVAWLNGQQYAFSNFNDGLWVGGESLVASGGGDAVPPFTASVIAPSPAVILSPSPIGTERSISASPSSNLSITWKNGGAGQLQVRLISANRIATCSFNASDSAGVVPADALAFLGTGTATQMLTSQISTSTTSAGDWNITMNATVNPTFSDGSSASLQLVLR